MQAIDHIGRTAILLVVDADGIRPIAWDCEPEHSITFRQRFPLGVREDEHRFQLRAEFRRKRLHADLFSRLRIEAVIVRVARAIDGSGNAHGEFHELGLAGRTAAGRFGNAGKAVDGEGE